MRIRRGPQVRSWIGTRVVGRGNPALRKGPPQIGRDPGSVKGPFCPTLSEISAAWIRDPQKGSPNDDQGFGWLGSREKEEKKKRETEKKGSSSPSPGPSPPSTFNVKQADKQTSGQSSLVKAVQHCKVF